MLSGKRSSRHMDYVLVVLILFLLGFGLIMIYSTSSYKGSLYHNDRAYWLKKQALNGAIGLVFLFFLAKTDYHVWVKKNIYPWIYYGMTALLLALTLLLATASHGSKRWIQFGPIRFQPSEMSKITMIIFLAYYISNHSRELRKWKELMKIFFLTLPIIGLVGVENLSTSIILLGISVIMIFVASPQWKPFLLIGITGITGATILLVTQSYRLDRIKAWIDPEHSEHGGQTIQGLYAIGSGGLFGKGIGNSIQKMGFVPEAHNDMIFSILCEELGVVGAVTVIILFMIMIWRFIKIALQARDLFGSMLVMGVMSHIAIQVFVNIGVVTNTIPNTGVPLPFISYGGTSLIFLLMEIGFVLSVSRDIRI